MPKSILNASKTNQISSLKNRLQNALYTLTPLVQSISQCVVNLINSTRPVKVHKTITQNLSKSRKDTLNLIIFEDIVKGLLGTAIGTSTDKITVIWELGKAKSLVTHATCGLIIRDHTIAVGISIRGKDSIVQTFSLLAVQSESLGALRA